MSRFPFPIPNGWFQIAWSHELPNGGVLPVRAFGKHLVLFRGEDGRAALLDAYCPHLGADIGAGGVVHGNAIACPFHHWAFDGSGTCVSIPYASRIPPKARLERHPLLERNRMIFAYHHARGEAPTWEVPEVPEATDASWTELETHRWEIRTHNQEIGENSVDRAHFRYVHGTKEVPESEFTTDGPVRHAVQHVTLDTPRGPVRGRIEVNAYGMGFTTTRFTGITETLLLISHMPVDGEHVVSRFSFTQPKASAGSNVARAIVRDVVKQMNEDIPIWEHKRYLTSPILCDGDGPIAPYRRWTQQFYS